MVAEIPYMIVKYAVRFASLVVNDPVIVSALCVFLVVATALYFREQKKIPYLANAIVFAFILGLCFKAFLAVERPCVSAPGKVPCPPDYSLPSMHSLLAFTLAIASIGSGSFPIFLLFSIFVAFSRVYLGVHMVPEVFAGMALAFFACVLTEILWSRMKWKVPKQIHIKHDLGKLGP